MNKRITRGIWVLVLLCSSLSLSAQEALRLDQAFAKALERNNTIVISQNNVTIAETNAHPGTAGLLPTVSGSANADYGLNNTSLELLNDRGNPIVTKGAQSLVLGASLNANYRIFGGFAGSNNYEKLQVAADLSSAQSRLEIENVLLQVASAYYNVLRTERNLETLRETIAISRRRLDEAQARRELSGGSKINVLGAQVDLNKDSVNLLNAHQANVAAMLQLNQLMGNDLEQQWTIVGEEALDAGLDFDQLLADLAAQNAQLQVARYGEQSSVLDYKISRNAYLPTLDLSAKYSYNRTEAEGSFLRVNQSNGLGGTLVLSIPIYAGGTRRRTEKNNQILMQNRQLQVKETRAQLELGLRTAFQDYRNAVKIVEMEQSNVATAEQNFAFSTSLFKLGQISNTQFREAQLNLLLTKNNLNNVTYNARLAELELLRLSGRLIVE